MARVRYNVDMVSQQNSPVCWLACATMVIQFKRRLTPSAARLNQLGLDFRMPGARAISYGADPETNARLRALGFVVTLTSAIQLPLPPRTPPTMAPPRHQPHVLRPEPSEELILWLLANHGPFILQHFAGSFSYGPGIGVPAHKPGAAHAVVVTGIDTAFDRVYFNNPWGNKDVPTSVSSIVGAIRRFEAAGGSAIAYM